MLNPSCCYKWNMVIEVRLHDRVAAEDPDRKEEVQEERG